MTRPLKADTRKRRGGSPRLWKSLLASLFLPVALTGLSLWGGVNLSDSQEARTEVGGIGLFSQPIPGELVTLAEAGARVTYPIPILLPRVLTDPCTGMSAPVTLLAAWATGVTDTVPEERQIGLTFSHGIWMSLSPPARWNFPDTTELPTVEQAYDPADTPASLLNGQVRGHTAWTAEPAKPATVCVPDLVETMGQVPGADGENDNPPDSTEEVLCSGLDCIPSPTPPPTPEPDPNDPLAPPIPPEFWAPVEDACQRYDDDLAGLCTNYDSLTDVAAYGLEAVMYQSDVYGGLTWKENGVVIYLTGPYSVATLKTLAEDALDSPVPSLGDQTGIFWYDATP